MEIRAYHESYLADAMTTMGTMLDYAVNFLGETIDPFFQAFVNLGLASQFENGNPEIIAGKSGVELCRMVQCDFDTPMPQYVSFERSPEFWVGWSLAYEQWYTGRSFHEIIGEVRPSQMIAWYSTLHEADVMCFVDEVESRFRKKKSSLQIWREKARLSQMQLANLSGVSLRSIQVYEQKQNDISKAQFNILTALARVLGCTQSDLMDTSAMQLTTPIACESFRTHLTDNIEEYYRRISQLHGQKERENRESQLLEAVDSALELVDETIQ